ncbi:hypothetical protein BDY17DRAFT_324559 [Neohortaea acidophila]|uniref:MADS-box domain-containing protein n=1 Tax=Neohortaea acidophila TaxID=245834 RepID=A0A6A6PRI9_9PEZI|nr:uncharacterized protein BDY17DRAFT_324559 [Neohortaea acidophila]KAF2482264.1 hypothetical protein BDY17DRAFT_324559 [Neohortaea acidophila]
MGRRKIEIKPIRDERNRSVTFLKRKGGLFKKAHELSVLCHVEVAVIIYDPTKKKVHDYSSVNINDILAQFTYCTGAREHKGPQDFADRGGGDDDEDEEDGGDEGEQHGTPQPDPQAMGMQHHPAFQHVRHGTPQGSPPMHNGGMPQQFQRGPSPLPTGVPHVVSRPSSRADQHQGHARRISSNLVPTQHQQAPMAQAAYAYQPNPAFYNPQAPQMHRPAGPGGPALQPQGSTYPPPYPPPGSHHAQMQQVLMQDARRSSMPTAFPAQPPPQANMQRDASHEHLHAPPQPRQPHPSPRAQHVQAQRVTPPQPAQQQFISPPIPQPRPLSGHAKSQSMFTPIDDSRSMLAQHWGSTSSAEALRLEPKTEQPTPRAASVDVATMQRQRQTADAKPNGSPEQPQASSSRAPPKSPQPASRAGSTPSIGLSRSSTSQPDAKRPRLKVQIPSEQSDGEGGTASARTDASASRETAGSGGDKQQTPGHGVVLPPPSPSAGALLSAGAQGPPNPFARPAPPMSTNPHAMNRDVNNSTHIETPISALPSRFMSDNLLPSPSTFYPEWGFGRSGGDSAGPNMLPSPLNFQTPVVGNGAGWREEDRRERDREMERKRASEDEAGGDAKRPRS